MKSLIALQTNCVGDHSSEQRIKVKDSSKFKFI